jgi:hypothetical protein
MRLKTMQLIRAAAHFVGRILDVQLPVAGAAGLRTH